MENLSGSAEFTERLLYRRIEDYSRIGGNTGTTFPKYAIKSIWKYYEVYGRKHLRGQAEDPIRPRGNN
jgi:hypothetical protein